MECKFCNVCGGCCFRDLSLIDYQQKKVEQVRSILKQINQDNINFNEPVFVSDGCRRRASFAFARRKGKIVLGFNEAKSSEIVDIDFCPMLTSRINSNINFVRNLLEQITKADIHVKDKKKKNKIFRIEQGDIWITEADNGLDVVLEFDGEPNLEIRQIIFEIIAAQDDIIRYGKNKTIYTNCRS